MKRKSDDPEIDKRDIVYSHVFYQRDCNGRGEGWYFMLSRNAPYGPFPEKEVANTILESAVSPAKSKATRNDSASRKSSDA